MESIEQHALTKGLTYWSAQLHDTNKSGGAPSIADCLSIQFFLNTTWKVRHRSCHDGNSEKNILLLLRPGVKRPERGGDKTLHLAPRLRKG